MKNKLLYANKLIRLFEKKRILSTSEFEKEGISKYFVNILIEGGSIRRVSRGHYSISDEIDDEFFLAQMNNKYLVFSNETASYLHLLTGRYPSPLSVTTKAGYHLRDQSLKKYYVNEELLYLGAINMKDPFGNDVIVYDMERTVCDIIKNKNRIETQVYFETIQNYFKNEKVNTQKLIMYSKKLSVEKKVMEIAQLFMEP